MADPQPDARSDARPDALAAAMQAHRAGRLDEARAAYEAMLAVDPDHPDALHLLGLLHVGLGRRDESLRLIRRAVELRPHEAIFQNNLGNLCQTMGRLDEAEQAYMAALEADPSRLEVYNNAAMLQARRGDLDAASRTLQRVIDVAPQFTDARQNLATIHLRGGRLHDAVRECCEAMITSPQAVGLRRLLGQAYALLGQHDNAIRVYRDWLADEPGSVQARHHLAALTGEGVPDRASDDYVRATFDDFAVSFDAKLESLGYRAPWLVAARVEQRLGTARGALDIADAGCGTGLCGPLMRPFARRLAGVDLSVPMLERARERRCYDELVQDELVAFLEARPAAFDVLISADTLCYFGRLEAFAAAARRSLRGGGLLVFTVESHADADGAAGFVLHPHGRYSHRLGYLRAVLGDAGFDGFEAEAVVLRQEAGRPVEGWLVEAVAGSTVPAGEEGDV